MMRTTLYFFNVVDYVSLFFRLIIFDLEHVLERRR